MDPKLAADVYWFPHHGGVHVVRGPGRLEISGHAAGALLDRLFPRLDGSTSVEDLVGHLPEAKQEMVRSVIATLAESGHLKDGAVRDRHPLTDVELRTFAAEIAYIDYFHDSPAKRFARYRDANVVLVGAGLVLEELVHAALASGLRRVRVVRTSECPTDLGRIRRDAAMTAGRDPDQLVEVTEVAGVDPSALVDALGTQSIDVLLHASDLPMLARACAIGRAGDRNGWVVIQSLVQGDHAWIGPVSPPGTLAWESAWLRMAGVRGEPGTVFTDAMRGDERSKHLDSSSASIVANRLAITCLRWLTGIDDTTALITAVDMVELATTEHRFLPHSLHTPAAPESRTEFVDRVRGLATGPAVDEQELTRAAVRLFDERAGVLVRIDERDFTQLPLWVSQVTVSDGLRAGTGPESRQVVGVGLTGTEARRRATMAAIARYAALAIDRRRFRKPPGGLGSDEVVWAQDLATGQAELVDTSLATLRVAGGAAAGDVQIGLGWGLDWAEAVGRALLDRARALLMTEAAAMRYSPPEIDLAAAPLGARGARYRELLALARLEVRLHDLGAVLGIPAVASATAGRTLGYATGFDLEQAVTDVLESTLQWYQATTYDEVDYLPKPVPELAGEPDGPPLPLGTQALGGPAECADVLLRKGKRALAVPLDHDSAVAEVLPYIVRVVLVDV